ncbi:YbjP/YqhG family protein [Buttiauxella selenatireducens]|uniref:YbjP/YqhG family protein n=1 Tax=Buttiauxella selenatireducens TaxID=3073902 RepID=A0ABY9S9A6_9ENTR|nr:YbjP/YqhG family protein [Buttiauxella sp. R73]WMY74088.1 YbjP/YqhG family protein [Buttiauxella sp. R73]
MRALLLVSLLLMGCTTRAQTPKATVRDFYHFYLTDFVSDGNENPLTSAKMQQYVAKETLTRLKAIQDIEEQEIVEADYFTYCQDYAAEWIPALEVGTARDDAGGKVLDVWLGIEGGKKLKLRDYLRQEDGNWKIYRVVDVSNGFEQNIFDDKAISAAKAHAATLSKN